MAALAGQEALPADGVWEIKKKKSLFFSPSEVRVVLSGATWIFLVRPVAVLVLGRPSLFIFCNFCVLDYQFQANSELWRQKTLCFWERVGRN